LSRIWNPEVSNLRNEEANWKQQAMIRITKVSNQKNKIGGIASASPRKTNYKLIYA